MATLELIQGGPGHLVEVAQLEYCNGQGRAFCECGWSRQDAVPTLSSIGAWAHARATAADAKAQALEPAEE